MPRIYIKKLGDLVRPLLDIEKEARERGRAAAAVTKPGDQATTARKRAKDNTELRWTDAALDSFEKLRRCVTPEH